jgi:predicted small secreted protein
MPMSPRAAALALLCLAALGLAACENTIRGAGRDISNTGRAVAGAVQDVAD